jgi:cobalt-zinc-cadmium efflux system membrane fusion protein
MLPHFAAVLAAAAVLASVAGLARAHEGHNHAEQPGAVSGPTGARGESVSGAFELVAIARGTVLHIYLDQFATNAPVADADITVETPAGSKPATPSEGKYRLDAPFLAMPGRYDLIFTIVASGAIEVIPLTLEIPKPSAERPASERHRTVLSIVVLVAALAVGIGIGAASTMVRRRRVLTALPSLMLAMAAWPWSVSAHEGHIHGDEKTPVPSASSELAQKLSDGTIFVPKPVQRIFALRTIVTESGAFNRSVELSGRIIPDPNASGFVQASVGGRLSPPPGGFPHLGTVVRKGDVLAHVERPIQAIDVSDMRQRQGELDQQISIVEGRLVRYQRLAPSGAIARQLLDEALLEIQGLKERRKSLDQTRRESESLIAPVNGIIADGTPVAGQITQPNAVVFHIVDPARLWVEAWSFSAIMPTVANATTGDGKTLRLDFRGSGFADRNQTTLVHFAIEGDSAGLRAGQFVTVLVATEEKREGIAVARAAVVRNANGQDFVFEHTAPERFVARAVRTLPLDGNRTLVLAGIDPGKRIVVQGAELLDHVR